MPVHAEQNGNATMEVKCNGTMEVKCNGHGINGNSVCASTVVFGSRPITIEDVVQISRREVDVKLNDEDAFVKRINQGPITLQKLLNEDHIIYGVNTGYGNSCTVRVSKELVAELPSYLVRYHCTGLGEHFKEDQTRALLTARIVSLTKGFSAVRLDLLKQLVKLLQNDILPMVPQEGSVGASGDLTPLSYVAAVLCGERKVMYEGQVLPTTTVFEQVINSFVNLHKFF